LHLDPNLRWTASQAMKHPFIRQTKYEGPFIPSATPEPVVEETVEDLLFAGSDLATDMAEMEVELDEEDEEEAEKEEARRIKPRAAPLAIARSRQAAATGAYATGSSSLSKSAGKSLGLSSSQQRYKRKLSEANAAQSPGTAASSFTSVLGSPITRPDVPYPIAHQSRWSDLGLLASPKVGPLGIPYHSVIPPLDQLGSPGGNTTFNRASAINFGSSLPNHRTMLAASDVPAFRRLEFPTGNVPPVQSSIPTTGPTSTNLAGVSFWPFPNHTGPSNITGASMQMSSYNKGTSIGNNSGLNLDNPTVLNHLNAAAAAIDPLLMLSNSGSTVAQAGSTGEVRLSSSWTSPSALPDEMLVLKKRSESDNGISDISTQIGLSSSLQSTGGSSLLDHPVSSAVVVEKSLEKWAPFDKDKEENKEEKRVS
jgi:hypothetical protein